MARGNDIIDVATVGIHSKYYPSSSINMLRNKNKPTQNCISLACV